MQKKTTLSIFLSNFFFTYIILHKSTIFRVFYRRSDDIFNGIFCFSLCIYLTIKIHFDCNIQNAREIFAKNIVVTLPLHVAKQDENLFV